MKVYTYCMQTFWRRELLLVLISLFFMIAAPVGAQPLQNGANTGFPQGDLPNGAQTGNPSPVYSNAPIAGGSHQVNNPLGGINSFCGLIKKLLQAAIEIGIPIAVLFIIYGGFKFVMAQGNPKLLGEARQNFLWTVVGIGIFLGAWLLAMVIAATVNAVGGQNYISCN
jgi:hypothetical protein